MAVNAEGNILRLKTWNVYQQLSSESKENAQRQSFSGVVGDKEFTVLFFGDVAKIG